MRYAIILSGGIGSRFWPLSKPLEPKQFLNICSDKSMLEETIARIDTLIKKENIYLAVNKAHKQKIRNCIKNFGIPPKNILSEPKGKNTLAPIAVLSAQIKKADSDAVVAILPCDHFVKYRARFRDLLSKGMRIAGQGYIVTLGIPAHRPETGYGYIRVKSKIQNPKSKIYEVDKFIEKPGLAKAKKLIKDKRYYWNSGIFIFRPDIILKEIKRLIPEVYDIAIKINNKKNFDRLWQGLPSVSIDYAIMEKAKKIILLPADYGWIDLGSWRAIEEFAEKNKDGNIFRGNCIDIGSKNTLIWSDNRLAATLGLDNIVIVNTKDALLVCSKDRTQDVKKIAQILKQKKYEKVSCY